MRYKKEITTSIIIMIIVITAFVFFNKFTYPYGWDVGYYFDQTSLIEQTSKHNERIGYTFLSVSFHQITGLSLVSTQVILPFLLFIFFNCGICRLLHYLFDKYNIVGIVSFALLMFNYTYLIYITSLFDNFFAMTLMSAALLLIALLLNNKNYKYSSKIIALFLILLTIALTHFETFIFTQTIISIIIILSIKKKNIVYSIMQYKSIIISQAFSIIFFLLHWKSKSINYISSYLSEKSSISDSSIKYIKNNNETITDAIANFFINHQVLFNLSLISIFSATGIIVIVFKTKNKNIKKIFLAWILSSYLLFLVAITKNSIPINRAMHFIPLYVFFIIGFLFLLVHLKQKNSKFCFLIIILMLLLSFLKFNNSITKQVPTVSLSTINSLDEIKKYVLNKEHNNSSMDTIFITNTPKHEKAANAYFGMWKYWLKGNLYEVDRNDYCIYFGEYNDLLNNTYPSVRENNIDYNKVSKNSTKCLNKTNNPKEYIVIKEFNPELYTQYANLQTTKKIYKDIISIPSLKN